MYGNQSTNVKELKISFKMYTALLSNLNKDKLYHSPRAAA